MIIGALLLGCELPGIEAARQRQNSVAEGRAGAILSAATATAKGVHRVPRSLVAEGGEQDMQPRIAETCIAEFGRLAAEGNMLVVRSNLSNLSSMIALATTIAKKEPTGSAVEQ